MPRSDYSPPSISKAAADAAYVPLSGGTSTGEQVAPDFKATGKTGATTQATILAGGTATVAPTTGAHVVGELVLDATGGAWFCTVAGTPGTWVRVNKTANDLLYDALGAAAAKVSDTAYDATSWNGVTDVAPSKNAVRDKIESLASGGSAGIIYANGLLDDGGAADQSATLTAIAATVPAGGTLVLPPYLVKVPTVTWPAYPIFVDGQGWYNYTQLVFGNAGLGVANYGTNFGGSILYMPVTSGTAYTLGPAAVPGPSPQLSNVLILGPNSGTSTGLLIRNLAGCKPLDNVMVLAFAQAYSVVNVEDCEIAGMRSRGCSTGAVVDGTSNNNTFTSFENQMASVIGLHDSGQANVWNTPLIQNCTGRPFLLDGQSQIMSGLYQENSAAASHSQVTHNALIQYPICSTSADYIDFVGSSSTYIGNTNSGRVSDTTSGNHMFFSNATMSLQSTVAIGQGYKLLVGNTADVYGGMWRDLATGDTVLGSGGSVVVKSDVDNGRVLRTYGAATASRPSLGAGDVGAFFYDTTLKRMIVWDGTAWQVDGSKETYGDGSDGVLDFDGTNTRLGLVPSSNVYTLTRDIFLAGGSQLSGSAVIVTANYRIFCRGTLTIGASATVRYNGNAGSGATAGGALSTGIFGATTTAGGAGSAGGTGSTGTAGAINPGGSGGAGGIATGSGTGGGQIGGAATDPATNGSLRQIGQVLLPIPITASVSRYSSGCGGGGGTAAASSTSGGGGGAGGVVCILAYNLVITGTIQALGGNGGNASGAGTGAGGGGGGGGGVIILVYQAKSGAASTLTAATNCAGGSGGNRQGVGANGAVGSNGTLIEIAGTGA